MDKEKIVETVKTAGVGGAAGAIAGHFSGRKEKKKRGLISKFIWFFIALMVFALVMALLPAIIGIGIGIFLIKKGNEKAGYISIGVGILISVLIFVSSAMADTSETSLGEYNKIQQELTYEVVDKLI